MASRHAASRHARDGTTPEDVAQELFAEFLARRAEGDSIEIEDFSRKHPEQAGRLRELFVGWDDFELDLAALGARARESEFHAELRAGQQVGDFRLLELIAAGGMGQVWCAHQVSLDRRVALKVMKPERATERGRLFFEREARAGGRLSHPGLVSIHAAGEDEGVHWIAMELVEGGRTLREAIHDLRARSELAPDHYEWVARLFLQVCDAVEAAHACQVIHRDLKPSNVLITPEGEPKVTDFGLARIVDELALSRTGEFAGTYFYMSPEQVTARRIGIDHRTDVFSLGVVLYEVLTLQRPFEGETGHEVAERILYDQPRDPRRIGSEVPAPLAWICAKAIEKRRADRYETMRAFRDDLERFLGERKPRARPAGPIRKLRRWSRRRPAMATGLSMGGVLLLLLLAMGAWVLDGSEEKQRAEWSALVESISLEALYGDLDEARRLAGKALELYPSDPEPHIALAAAYTANGHWVPAYEQLRLALELGADEGQPADDDAAGRTRRAMLRYAGDGGSKEQAFIVEELEASLVVDPRQSEAWFLLYQTTLTNGDHERAAEAIAKVRGSLPENSGPARSRWLDGLEHEAAGEHEEAVAVFEALLADDGLDGGEREDLPIARVYGRTLLALALEEGDLVLIDRAQAAFEAAVSQMDQDMISRVHLARTHLLRVQQLDRSELATRNASVESARNLLAEGLSMRPAHQASLDTACTLEVLALTLRMDELGPPPGDEWVAAHDGLEALRAVAPDHPTLSYCEAWLAYLRARSLIDSSDWDAVLAEVQHCSELEPDHLWALGLGPQGAYWRAATEFYEARGPDQVTVVDEARAAGARELAEVGLELADRGVAVWEGLDSDWRERWGPAGYGDLLVWRLLCADLAERPELFAESRAALGALLDAGTELPEGVLLNYAEHLACTQHEGSRDCELARELVEASNLGVWLEDPERGEGALAIAAQIRANCGF